MPLHVNSFGGGAVIQGSADTRRIDEVLAADSVDIGPRGALIATSDLTDYVTLNDGSAVPVPWSRIYALLASMPGYSQALVLAVGEGVARDFPGNPYGPCYLINTIQRVGQASPLGAPLVVEPAVVIGQPPPVPHPAGAVVTGLSWPGAWLIPGAVGMNQQVNVAFFCVGAREGFAPKSAAPFGLYVMVQNVGLSTVTIQAIGAFNALGTGPLGDGTLHGAALDTGASSQQLYARGCIAFNNFLFLWGFDSADVTNGDGPARVMFSNLGLPLKFGNDNLVTPPVGNRLFTDSDAIGLGDAGEIIRGAVRALGKLFFGTNRGLHFIQGYGRDTFVTNGSIPVMKAFNIGGPGAIIEGPDRLVYGVGDQGLWRYDGYSVPEALFLKNWDFTGHSAGYWELLWTNPLANANSYPGRTNRDLVWMTVDYDKQQVIVGIPFCNATSGSGTGSDTVLIKFHVQTGGFTRQVMPGVALTCAAYLRQEGQQPIVRWMGELPPGVTVRQYAYQPASAASPIMPSRLPLLTFGPYAPFGPDGEGVTRRVFCTASWEAAASLPLVFQVTSTADQAPNDSYLLTIGANAPTNPATGDCWLDTSNSDPSLGNLRAGASFPASGGYLFKVWELNTWQVIQGMNATGTRATMPLPMKRRPATRVTLGLTCVQAAGRFQIEGLGFEPGGGTPDL